MKCNAEIKRANGWYRCSVCSNEFHPGIEIPFCFPRPVPGYKPQRMKELEAEINKVKQEESRDDRPQKEWSDQERKDALLTRMIIV